MFYSQAGQDVWVLQKVGNRGFYVDVGAYDGIESSNTYALELVGWIGVCIEPNKDAYKKLYKNRSGYLANVAVNNTNNKLSLLLHPHHNVLDYLSIDVDGGELQVLEGMDFEYYKTRLITIEHNFYLEGSARQEQIFDYLSQRGFSRVVKDVKCLDPNYFGAIYEDWYENSIYL